jgi:membrane-bound lytic murein transglycosylase A
MMSIALFYKLCGRRTKAQRRQLWAITLSALILLTACAPTPMPPLPPLPPPPVLERLTPEAYPRFEDQFDYENLGAAVEMSLVYLKRLPPEKEFRLGEDTYTAAHLIASLEAFAALAAARPSAEQFNRAIASDYLVYRAAGGQPGGKVIYTGYYEPLLNGSRTPSAEYSIPVHSRPVDLVDIDLSLFSPDLQGRRIVGRITGRTVVPYPDRGGIRHEQDFNTIAPPIAWLRDEIDLFILQIQGSGRVQLDTGEQVLVQFDGSNGHPYGSVGRLLIDSGKISADAMSMQAIRTYLRRNPAEREPILDHNPRYIFFKEGTGAPRGALDVPLTPMRSMAVDRRIFPSAALGFIATSLPRVDEKGAVTEWFEYRGFALAQDAGSAIKGPGRVDLFWGYGPQAEAAAGRLKNPGQLYFLVLRPPKQ